MELPSLRSAIGKDVLEKTLTLMPLYQFQQIYAEEGKVHQLTFAQRYRLKYDTYFPYVKTAFETEEDQYLFCAFYFHHEIGLRSHLFVETEVCLVRAIDLEDQFLFQYFYERMGKHPNTAGVLEYILEHKKYKMIPVALNYQFAADSLFINWRLPQEVARQFISSTSPSGIFLCFANLPIAELPSLVEIEERQSLHVTELVTSALHGLLIARENSKTEIVRNYFANLKLNVDGLIRELSAVIHLDDLEIFKTIWSIVGSKRINTLLEKVIVMGATQIATWVVNNLSIKNETTREFTPDIIMLNIDPLKQLEVLNMVISKYPIIADDDIANFVWIRNSDPLALSSYQHADMFSSIHLAYQCATEDFNQTLIRKINETDPGVFGDIYFDLKEARKLVLLGVSQEYIQFSCHLRLTYPEYLELLEWKFNSRLQFLPAIPCMDLERRFTDRLAECDIDPILISHIMKTEHPFLLRTVTRKAFYYAIKTNNYEYLARTADQFRGEKFVAINQYYFCEKMAAFLATHEIAYVLEY